MRATTNLPLTMRKNDNPWRRHFAVETPAGEPLDMRGHQARMQLRFFAGAPGLPAVAIDVPIFSTFSSGVTFSNGERFVTADSPNGSGIVMLADGFIVTITNRDLALLPTAVLDAAPLRIAYDILVRDPAGQESAWYEGNVTVWEGVTRHFTQVERDAYIAAVSV